MLDRSRTSKKKPKTEQDQMTHEESEAKAIVLENSVAGTMLF